MEVRQDLAVVLKVVPYQDRNQIVTALTEHHGCITAVARNSVHSRRFGGSLSPFTASQWRYVRKEGAELCRLDEALIKRDFPGLRNDFSKLSMASAMNEIILRLAPPDEPCAELFKLHTNALHALDELEAAPVSLLNAYLVKCLHWSGVRPKLHVCKDCGTPLTGLASIAAMKDDRAPVREESLLGLVAGAGWICEECRRTGSSHVSEMERSAGGGVFRTMELSALSLLDATQALGLPVRRFIQQTVAPEEQHRALFTFLEGLLIYHIPGFDRSPLKSLRFLELKSNLDG